MDSVIVPEITDVYDNSPNIRFRTEAKFFHIVALCKLTSDLKLIVERFLRKCVHFEINVGTLFNKVPFTMLNVQVSHLIPNKLYTHSMYTLL